MSSVHKVSVTGYDAALLRLLDLAQNDNAKAVAIAGGGTGYVVGDILTVSGGTVVSSLTTTLEVISVAAGVIDGIRIFNCGAYSATPTNAVSVTGGTGSGATFNLTWETQNWTVNRNVASSTALISYPTIQGGGGVQVLDREVLLEGPGNGGLDEIYCGILEVQDTNVGSFNWALAGMTGFDTLNEWEDQPGFSYISPNEIAAFVPLTDGAIECWFHVSPRSLKGILRIGATYNNFTIGFLNPFATPTEYPYPLYIGGCSSKWNELPGTTGVAQSGLIDPGAYSGTGGNLRGPGGIRHVDGGWYTVQNWTYSGSTRTDQRDASVYPAQTLEPLSSVVAPADKFLNNTIASQWNALIPDTGVPGTATHVLQVSDDPGGDLTILVPNFVFMTVPQLQILGEIDGVFWGSTTGNNIVSQDRIIINGEYYRAFQNCNRSDAFSFFFMKEDV